MPSTQELYRLLVPDAVLALSLVSLSSAVIPIKDDVLGVSIKMIGFLMTATVMKILALLVSPYDWIFLVIPVISLAAMFRLVWSIYVREYFTAKYESFSRYPLLPLMTLPCGAHLFLLIFVQGRNYPELVPAIIDSLALIPQCIYIVKQKTVKGYVFQFIGWIIAHHFGHFLCLCPIVQNDMFRGRGFNYWIGTLMMVRCLAGSFALMVFVKSFERPKYHLLSMYNRDSKHLMFMKNM